jgi:hypothetical protein
MKRLTWVLMALSTVWAGQAIAGGVVGNVNLLLGSKHLDSTDWRIKGVNYDQQSEVGVLFDIADDSWPVSLAVDLVGSAVKKSPPSYDGTGSTVELDVGVRKIFNFPGSLLHPYVGGGLAFVTARYEEKVSSYYYASGNWHTQESGNGLWLNGGVYWSFWKHFNVGLDVRYSKANVTLYDYYGKAFKVDAGGKQAGLLMGYRW